MTATMVEVEVVDEDVESLSMSQQLSDQDSLPVHPFASDIAQLLDQKVPNLEPGSSHIPRDISESSFTMIATADELRNAVSALTLQTKGCARIAVDMEAHAQHTYCGMSCLIQISTGTAEYIIDTIALKGCLDPLKPILQDKSVLKVLHGAGNDVAWLQRDFGIFICNIFDTEKACQVLGYQQRSLAHLLLKFCGVTTNKVHQQADWRVRPLPADCLEYSRLDVHYLLYIADRLAQELLAADNASSTTIMPDTLTPESHLARAVHRSQLTTLNVYVATPSKVACNTSALTIMKQIIGQIREEEGFVGQFSDSEVRRLETIGDCVYTLCSWRDHTARQMDEGVQCILPDRVLAHIAQAQPGSLEELHQVLSTAPEVSQESCCQYPAALMNDAETVLEEFIDAAQGQKPWVHPQLQEILRPQLHGKHLGKKHMDPEAFKQSLADRFSSKKEVYENCRMLSSNGELLCYTDRKRLEWYIRKGLAELVAEEPFTVRLLFEHKTSDQDKNLHRFYTAAKHNRCVACGEGSHWLRYRIVPSCYRRALPVHMKSHRSHDIVLLCVTCHELAQVAAARLKRLVAEEYNVPLLPPVCVTNENDEDNAQSKAGDLNSTPYGVRRAAVALRSAGDKMPLERRVKYNAQIRAYIKNYEPGFLPDISEENECTDDSFLTPLELQLGLLAGMAPKTRRKTLRRWAAEEDGNNIHPALLGEINSSQDEYEHEPPRTSYANRQSLGHEWHGEEVIKAASEKGGDDELVTLCVRFRQAFIQALKPRFLPENWDIAHAAPRKFGECSVYYNT